MSTIPEDRPIGLAPGFRFQWEEAQGAQSQLRGRLEQALRREAKTLDRKLEKITDTENKLEKRDAVVLGVSPDGAESHAKFVKKYGLPFRLLSDPDKKVMTKYGAFGEKMMYGKKTVGVIRSTVWIDPAGKVKKHWARVPKAADHPARVLEALQGEG